VTTPIKTRGAAWCANVVLATGALLLCAGAAHAQVTGAGATSVRELMTGWAGPFGAALGGVSYEAAGSSAGVAKVTELAVDFGVTDVPLVSVELRKSSLRQLPLSATAVAVIVNLPELSGTAIKLNGYILADIYQGSITNWNHTQIAGLNPGVKLPNKPIVPVWREDGSGQSYAFTGYLARNHAKWRRTLSTTYKLALPVGKGVRGGQAMVDAVKSTPGAVGYEGLGAAQKSGLALALLQNASGKTVAPSSASISVALNAANWSGDTNAADLDGSDGEGTYPITSVAYALLPITPKPGRKSALPFLQAAVAQGDAQVNQAGFVPLPAKAKSIVADLR
jgi:phosphate transport system substrate-binding protein